MKDFLIENSDVLQLQVRQYKWIDEWFPGFFDFEVEINASGKSFRGRAVDSDQDHAFVKAGAEAIERAVAHAHGLKTTSGVAVHYQSEQAGYNAIREMIERDAFFCHYLTKVHFSYMPETIIGQSLASVPGLVVRLKGYGINLHFAQMRVGAGFYGVACAIEGYTAKVPFGIRLGLGCDRNLSAALQQSLFECLRSMIALIEGQTFEAKSLNLFSAQSFYKASDHADLGLDIEASKPTSRLFDVNKEPVESHTAGWFVEPAIHLRPLALPQGLEQAPLVALAAFSPELQSGYIGRLTEKKVNLPRLSQFAGKALCFSSLEQSPHIFG